MTPCISGPRTFDRRQLLVTIGALGFSFSASLRRRAFAARAAEQQIFTDAALERAFGDSPPSWDPADGYRANRETVVRCYDYYRSLYQADPERFLWAGLARMVGGSVVHGLDVMVDGKGYIPGLPDPSFVPNRMVELGKTIFFELAWQHELVLGDPSGGAAFFATYDVAKQATNPYSDIWSKIVEPASEGDIAEGNLLLLMNEQYDLVQPAYDAITSARSDLAFGFSYLATAVHHYHRSFLETVPDGDATLAEDRWTWIAGPGGMWETWLAIPQAERDRLVGLDLDDAITRNWDPLLTDFLP
jgi:hypothetical protein